MLRVTVRGTVLGLSVNLSTRGGQKVIQTATVPKGHAYEKGNIPAFTIMV